MIYDIETVKKDIEKIKQHLRDGGFSDDFEPIGSGCEGDVYRHGTACIKSLNFSGMFGEEVCPELRDPWLLEAHIKNCEKAIAEGFHFTPTIDLWECEYYGCDAFLPYIKGTSVTKPRGIIKLLSMKDQDLRQYFHDHIGLTRLGIRADLRDCNDIFAEDNMIYFSDVASMRTDKKAETSKLNAFATEYLLDEHFRRVKAKRDKIMAMELGKKIDSILSKISDNERARGIIKNNLDNLQKI